MDCTNTIEKLKQDRKDKDVPVQKVPDDLKMNRKNRGESSDLHKVFSGTAWNEVIQFAESRNITPDDVLTMIDAIDNLLSNRKKTYAPCIIEEPEKLNPYMLGAPSLSKT